MILSQQVNIVYAKQFEQHPRIFSNEKIADLMNLRSLVEPVVHWLGRSTRNPRVPGSNPDPDTTDSSNPTQVFNVGTQHIGQ